MPGLDPINIGAIVVALTGAFGGWAAQRAATKATRFTAETEAYNRARKLDIETIERQDKEYAELEAKHKKTNLELKEAHEDNDKLRTTKRALLKQVESLNEQLRGRSNG